MNVYTESCLLVLDTTETAFTVLPVFIYTGVIVCSVCNLYYVESHCLMLFSGNPLQPEILSMASDMNGGTAKLLMYLLDNRLLTLGAHARGLRYLSCVSVCLCVCVSVYPSVPALAASASFETSKQRYSLGFSWINMCGVKKTFR